MFNISGTKFLIMPSGRKKRQDDNSRMKRFLAALWSLKMFFVSLPYILLFASISTIKHRIVEIGIPCTI